MSPVLCGPDTPLLCCISQLLTHYARCTPDAVALVESGHAPLTYGRLRQCMDEVVPTLRAYGVERHDRVAVLLPNGAAMAAAFLTVAAGATCMPLNPTWGADECARYFAHARVKALIVPAGIHTTARAVALAHGLCILELSPVPEAAAGLFTLAGKTPLHVACSDYALPDDVALILPTSGTTAQPKMVSLTHANICTAARHWCMALALDAHDCCLHVLPCFHVYGLIGTLLASLMGGGRVVCTAGFAIPTFFAAMAEFHPTWYAAVPALHQAILAHAAAYSEIITRYPFRFIRSGSAPLPLRVLTDLERVFSAPVLKGYGMTETAGQIACDPLPPQQRKPDAVGVAIGPEVAVIDETGAVLPGGTSGEIVVRGANVMPGYDNNPEATRSVFTADGWLRTGDQGYVDADGYLFITGRLKEIINRGGEKIVPQDVDKVLMEYPGVARPSPLRCRTTAWGRMSLQRWSCIRTLLRRRLLYAALSLPAWRLTRSHSRFLSLRSYPQALLEKSSVRVCRRSLA